MRTLGLGLRLRNIKEISLALNDIEEISATPTPTPTNTATPSLNRVVTPTPSLTTTVTPSITNTATPTATPTITPTVSPIQTAGLVLLLTGEDIDSATITDKSSTAKAVSAVGSVVNSSLESVYGDSSIYMGGGYLRIPYSEDFKFNLEDYTVEWWSKHSTYYNNYLTALTIAQLTGNPSLVWGWAVIPTTGSGSQTVRYLYSGVSTDNSYTVPNAWQHRAIVSKNGITTVYVDGKIHGSSLTPSGITSTNTTYPMTIGQTNYAFIDNFAMYKGLAKYSRNFIPADINDSVVYTEMQSDHTRYGDIIIEPDSPFGDNNYSMRMPGSSTSAHVSLRGRVSLSKTEWTTELWYKCRDTEGVIAASNTPFAGIITSTGSIALECLSVEGNTTALVARYNNTSGYNLQRYPWGVITDSLNNIYISSNTSYYITKITPTGYSVTLSSNLALNGARGIAIDSLGNLYVANAGSYTIVKITPDKISSVFAGTTGTIGTADGTGTAARFTLPTDIAIDSSDNLYVTDYTGKLIKKITPGGVVTTLAGTTTAGAITDGTGAAARFGAPHGIAIDSNGNLYVTDATAHTVRKITPEGVVTTFAGTNGSSGFANGTGAAIRFTTPQGIAIDSDNNLYVSDLNYVIRKITQAGVATTFVGTAGTTGSAGGTGTAATIGNTKDITIDSLNNIYITENSTHLVRRINMAAILSPFAGVANNASDSNSGLFLLTPITALNKNVWNHIALTRKNNVITLYINGLVAGAAPISSVATEFELNYPFFISGNIGLLTASIANIRNSSICRYTDSFTPPVQNFITDDNTTALFQYPYTGEYYINTIGKYNDRLYVNGDLSVAKFADPADLITDTYFNIYIADKLNHVIRKIDYKGNVTTFAGTGTAGFLDHASNPLLAQFNTPVGVATDSSNNVYVSDQGNRRIRKITQAGVVTTFCGNGNTGNAVGAATVSTFTTLQGIVVDMADNTVYVVDSGGYRIRKITTAGVSSLLAGSTIGYTDSATPANVKFNQFNKIALYGNDIYVADTNNNSIRKIVKTTGVTTTLTAIDSPVCIYTRNLMGGQGQMVMNANLNPGAESIYVNNQYGILVSSGRYLYMMDTYGNKVAIASANISEGTTDQKTADGVLRNAGIQGITSIVGVTDTKHIYSNMYYVIDNENLRKIYIPSSFVSKVEMLLKGDGQVGGSNNVIKDDSSNNYTISWPNGTDAQGSCNPYNYNISPNAEYSPSTHGGSIYFENNYIAVPTNVFNLGAGDFTIEFSVEPGSYLNAATTATVFMGYIPSNSADGVVWRIGVEPGYGLSFTFNQAFNSTVQKYTNNYLVASVSAPKWFNIAVQRKNNVWSIYINGSAVTTYTRAVGGTWSDSIDITNNSLPQAKIGKTTACAPFYMSNIRIVKGSAVFTGALPTAPLANIANTSLLLRCNNSSIFDSKANINLYAEGNTTISSDQVKNGTGSIYFDGINSYLQTPVTRAFNFGSDNLSIQFWIYPLSYGTASAGPQIFGTDGTSSGYVIALGTDINSFKVYASTTGQWGERVCVDAGGGPALNEWSHMAIIRDSGKLTIYKNGIVVAVNENASNWIFGGKVATIGKYQDELNTEFFNGYIDSLKVERGKITFIPKKYFKI